MAVQFGMQEICLLADLSMHLRTIPKIETVSDTVTSTPGKTVQLRCQVYQQIVLRVG
jgi:hypothetical protein